ncbi:MAG: thioesterase family protein [Maricaulis sp.]|nr:thioesterase family protein [Maricaulis sp.]MDG2043304.1 thioesterase family protein [Maricaulis sp.]
MIGKRTRSDYAVWRTLATRWADNDVYGHINNAAYYGFFDTAVNSHLIESGVLDIHDGEVIGLVVETGCSYFAPLAYPQDIEIGLRVAHLGNSSVRYELGLFETGQDTPAAEGHFVHVYVTREARKPASLPPPMRQILQLLVRDDA